MILDEFIELWQALLQYFYDYEKYVEIDQNRPRRLQNEALEVFESLSELFWTRWAIRGRSGDAPEASRGPSGSARGGLPLTTSSGPFGRHRSVGRPPGRPRPTNDETKRTKRT